MTIEIIIPQGTTNLVQNPSFERDLTGYLAAAGGALVRTTDEQRYGVAGAEYTPTAVIDDGLYYGPLTLGLGTQYTFSLEVKGADGDRYRIYAYDVAAGVTLTGTTDFLGTGEWERQSVTFFTGANPSIRLYLVKNGDTSTEPLYTDAWQLEAGEETTYCDGDQPGCYWTAGAHQSTSRRSDQSRAGGVIIDLSDYNIAIEELSGLGMPPRLHNVLPYATLPGAHLQSIKTMPRIIQLVCVTETSTEAAMYAALAQLEAAVTHDRYAPMQPIRMRYTRAGRLVQIDCYYDGGLEGQLIEHCYTRFTVRFIAYENPYWQEVAERSVALETVSSFGNNTVFRYRDGRWTGVGPAVAPSIPTYGVLGAAYDGNNRIYFCGDFINWNGQAAWDYLIYLDIETGEYGSVGTPNDLVTGVACLPNGQVIISGFFTSIDGTSINHVGRYDPVAHAWYNLGSGFGVAAANGVDAMVVDTDGTVIVAGLYDTGDIRVSSWDGSSWTQIGDPDGLVLALGITLDGWVHAAGPFLNMNAVAAKWQARRDPDSGVWEPAGLGGGAYNTTAPLTTFRRGPDGLLYAVGLDALIVGGVTITGNGRWTGTQWQKIGGAGALGADLAFAEDGTIWAAGVTQQGFPFGEGMYRLTLRNSLAVDLDLDSYDFQRKPSIVTVRNDVYFALKATGTHKTAGFTTITNESSTPVYPRFQFRRTGGTLARLVLIRNNTTGDELFFNIDLQDGEEILVDLSRPDKKLFSTFRDNPLSYLPGSNVSSFRLLPGDNELAVFVHTTGGATVDAFAIWRNTYLSVESAEA